MLNSLQLCLLCTSLSLLRMWPSCSCARCPRFWLRVVCVRRARAIAMRGRRVRDRSFSAQCVRCTGARIFLGSRCRAARCSGAARERKAALLAVLRLWECRVLPCCCGLACQALRCTQAAVALADAAKDGFSGRRGKDGLLLSLLRLCRLITIQSFFVGCCSVRCSGRSAGSVQAC